MDSPDPTLKALEFRRRWLATAAILGLGLFLAAGAASLYWMKAFSPWTDFSIFAVLLLGIAGWFGWQVPWMLLQMEYKDLAARPAVAAWRPGWSLDPEQKLDQSVLDESRFCQAKPDHYFSEDLAQGAVEGVQVQVSEVLATRNVKTRTSSGSRSTREVLFQGALGKAELGGPPWSGRYYLRPEGLTGYLARLPGNTVKLSDATFEKAFILSWDGPGTPPPVWDSQLCQEVLAIRTDLDLGFRLAWDGATLWMGTTSLIDLWEPPLWHRLDDGRRVRNALRPLEAMARLVHCLKGAPR